MIEIGRCLLMVMLLLFLTRRDRPINPKSTQVHCVTQDFKTMTGPVSNLLLDFDINYIFDIVRTLKSS